LKNSRLTEESYRGWVNIRKQEAIGVSKEIECHCQLLNPRAIHLEPAEICGHYELHVQSSVSDKDWRCLKTIARKNGLGIKLTNQILIIYKQTDRKIGKTTEV
jgi:hypothetical protein